VHLEKLFSFPKCLENINSHLEILFNFPKCLEDIKAHLEKQFSFPKCLSRKQSLAVSLVEDKLGTVFQYSLDLFILFSHRCIFIC
jgi:hypothetical protein